MQAQAPRTAAHHPQLSPLRRPAAVARWDASAEPRWQPAPVHSLAPTLPAAAPDATAAAPRRETSGGNAWPGLAVALLLPALAQLAAWRLAGHAGMTWPLLAAGLGLAAGLAVLRGPGRPRLAGMLALTVFAQALSGLLLLAGWQGQAVPWMLAQLLGSLLLLHRGRLLAEALAPRRHDRRWPALATPLAPPPPKVSLHLPTQDAPIAQLRETLDSLAGLDHPALEVLVVDASASPQRWEPVAEHCARLGPRFRFFHIGACPQQARAFALRETAADVQVIGLVEPGCAVDADWLRRCLPFFAAHPGLGFVQAATAAPDRSAAFARRLAYAADAAAWPLPRRAANEQMAVPLQASLALVRAEALRLAHGWDAAAPDQPGELGLRLLRQGWEALDLPEPMGSSPHRPETAPGLLHRLGRHADVLFAPRHRGLSTGQRRHLLGSTGAALLDALWLGMALLGIGVTLGLLATRHLAAAPLLPFALVALLLPAMVLLQAGLLAPRGHRGLAMLAALAGMPGRGAAAWRVATAWPGQHRALAGGPATPGSLAAMLVVLAGLSAAASLPWALLLLAFALPDIADYAVARRLQAARQGTAWD